jgi:hypothetical protein
LFEKLTASSAWPFSLQDGEELPQRRRIEARRHAYGAAVAQHRFESEAPWLETTRSGAKAGESCVFSPSPPARALGRPRYRSRSAMVRRQPKKDGSLTSCSAQKSRIVIPLRRRCLSSRRHDRSLAP